jgi:ribose transport system substrate-binding protein
MDSFISSGVDLILLNAADIRGIAPAVMRAKAAGITVVAVDVAAEGGVDATVTSNNKQAGELDGKYVADRLKGKGKVVIVNGPPVSAVTERVAGFVEVIKKYPDIKILSQDQNAGGSRDGGFRVMTDLLTAFARIDAVFAINDPTAIGCDLAARQAQRKDFFIVGVDAAPDVVPYLKDPNSLIAASAAQNPYAMAGKAVEIGYDIMNGKKAEQSLTLIPVDLITRENLDYYKGWLEPTHTATPKPQHTQAPYPSDEPDAHQAPSPSASPAKTHHHKGHHKKSTEPAASPSPQETPEAEETPTATPAPKPASSEATLPTFFPPKATATVEVPLHLIKEGISLGELAERLGRVMDSVGYVEKSFYSLDAVDNKGCAIVTHIEQIKADGTPVAEGRWSFELPNYAIFSVQTFLAALFTAQPGYYRLIALVVSEKPLVEKPNPLSPSQAEELIHGPKSPPPSLRTIPVTSAYRCIAYIYEFERPTRSHDPAFMKDSPDVTAQTHLASTGLWAALQKEQ